MSADIAARITDYLRRQTEALHVVEHDWMAWAERPGEWTDDDFTRIEETQERHARLMAPLFDEYQSLWKEWERADKTPEEIEAARRLAHAAGETATRVRELVDRLQDRIEEQTKSVKSAGDSVRRGLKLTRGYGGAGANDAAYLDRDA